MTDESGQRLVIARDGPFEHRDYFRTDSQYLRVRFAETMLLQFGWKISTAMLGEIDAMVWDVEETFATLGPGLADRPLSPATIEAVGEGNTIAALVARAADGAVATVIEAAMTGPDVLRIHEDVLEGRRTAEY